MGTPYYMAPEQAKGSREVDHRVDLYAVGVILYEALAGQVPFLADTFNELLFKIVLEQPRPLLELAPELDPAFAQLVAKAMAREPSQRYQTAQELQLALDEWAAGAGYSAAATGAYSALVQTAPVARAAMQSTPLAATPGTWSGTSASAGPAEEKRKPSRASLVASIAAIAIVAGGSGVFMLVSGKSPEPASSVASSGSADLAAMPPSASSLPIAAPLAPAGTEANKPPVVEVSPATSAKPSTARAVKAPAPAPRPATRAPAPVKAAEPSSPTGRKIRQTL
jgi:serine/threonine-protein kinase